MAPAAAPNRTLFPAYAPAALNDTAVPPFPGHEADEEEERRADGVELDFERPASTWDAIPPSHPPNDAPVRFIDGSIASKTVGSLLVAGRRRPLIAATIAAAALEVDGRSLRRGAGGLTRKVLCLHSAGIEREDILYAHRALGDIGVELLERTEASPQGDFDALRRSTRGLAMQAMEEAERRVMLADLGTPTLVDGLLERRLATAPSHNVPVVGLVKRQMTPYLPADLHELTYVLRPGERTPAFVLRTVQHVDLVNTYVRLSAQSGASPSYGVVRLTVPMSYVQAAHREDVTAYLSGLAAHVYGLRHRDLAYARSGISVEPIVRCEDHLHAIRPDLESLIPKLHRLFRREPA
jgi:hypothetical protein